MSSLPAGWVPADAEIRGNLRKYLPRLCEVRPDTVVINVISAWVDGYDGELRGGTPLTICKYSLLFCVDDNYICLRGVKDRDRYKDYINPTFLGLRERGVTSWDSRRRMDFVGSSTLSRGLDEVMAVKAVSTFPVAQLDLFAWKREAKPNTAMISEMISRGGLMSVNNSNFAYLSYRNI